MFIPFFLLFFTHTSLVAEEIDVSKGMIVTTSSGKRSLPPLNVNMTDASLKIAVQTTVVVWNELQFDLTMYKEEKSHLLRDIKFYEDKTSEDTNALNRIIEDHKKLEKLSVNEQKRKQFIVDEAKIAEMRKELETSSLRHLNSLEVKILRWANGNFLKLKFAEKQENDFFEYLIKLDRILGSRLPVKPKINSPRMVRYS